MKVIYEETLKNYIEKRSIETIIIEAYTGRS